MRTFVIKASKAKTDPNFSLDDLPGAGRMDLVARCISTALFISHALRQDADIYAVLEGSPQGSLTIHFNYKIKSVSPDERSVAGWIKKALQEYAKGKTKVNPGITIEKKSFRQLVESLSKRPIYALDESGSDFHEMKIKNDPVFIVGDHIGLLRNELDFLHALGAKKIKVGSKSYLASQVVAYLNVELDAGK